MTYEPSGNALRFGLINVRPFEVTDTIKRAGLKFRRTRRGYETITQSESFEDLVRTKNGIVFGTIKIPERFDADKLADVFSQHSIECYEKNTELKDAVEKLKNAGRKDRPLTSFIQFFRERFESLREPYLEEEAERYLSSNLPLSFYSKFVVFYNTFSDCLGIMEGIVRNYESRASTSRNFMMHKRIISEMQRRLNPIIDEMDQCDIAESRLRKYVYVWNAKDYDEVFQPEFLDSNRMDQYEYEDLYRDYDSKLRESRRFLSYYDPEIFRRGFDTDTSTTDLFGKLVLLPSGSLSLEG